jgi:hypothetical protein
MSEEAIAELNAGNEVGKGLEQALPPLPEKEIE